MEIVGTAASAVTLAGLFKLCIDAFDVIRTVQNQATDLKKLNLKLAIERCRLFTWGEAMGFTSATTQEGLRNVELISETLSLIISLFEDSQGLQSKYGCKLMSSSDSLKEAIAGPRSATVQQLNLSFNNFRFKSTSKVTKSSVLRKANWVIHDRKKFELLVHETRMLIDSLQDITKNVSAQNVQQDAMSSRIRTISDTRTLDWVSEICEVDYPALSDAASLRADTITDITTFHHDIQNWKDAVDTVGDDATVTSSVETTIADLEDMTVTELKHKLSSFLIKARDERLKYREAANESYEDTQSALSGSDQDPGPLSERMATALDKRRWGEIFESAKDIPASMQLTHDLASAYDKKTPGTKVETEDEINQEILADMAAAAIDREFHDELTAIEQWFDVLSRSEQAVTFYQLGVQLARYPEYTRFFARVQDYRAASSNSGPSTVGHLMDEKVFSGPSIDATQKSALLLPQTGYDPSKVKNTPQRQPPKLDAPTPIDQHLDGARALYSDFVKTHKRAISDVRKDVVQQNRDQQIDSLKAFSRNFRLEAAVSKSEDEDLAPLRKTDSTETLRASGSEMLAGVSR